MGGVHVFFASQPRIEMKFTGLAHLPAVSQKVQSVLDDIFRNNMVVPNVVSFHMMNDERIVDLTEASSHKPLGVLRVRVLRASNLAGGNWKMGSVERFTSNPYCTFRLGAMTHKSSTVRDTSDPEWPAGERSGYFVVYHLEQELEVRLHHEDLGGWGLRAALPRRAARSRDREAI